MKPDKTKGVKMTKIEVVDIRKVAGDGNLKALVDVKFSDSVIVKGFNVLKGNRGVFVSMPRKASKDGRWFDVLTPVNEEVKTEIETKVLEAYEKE
jgi:stage V sporulation protein G